MSTRFCLVWFTDSASERSLVASFALFQGDAAVRKLANARRKFFAAAQHAGLFDRKLGTSTPQ